jgi:putative hydrolase of the HAD superfamily
MLKYSGLLIDLDDTIIKTHTAYEPTFKYMYGVLSKRFKISPEVLREAFEKEKKELQIELKDSLALHNRLIIFQNVLDALGVEYNLEQISDVNDLFWNTFISNTSLFDGSIETLKELKENGVKIAIVSDGEVDIRIKKIEGAGLTQYIDNMVCSEEIGSEKPSPRMFTLALARINKNPEDVIMLGNNIVSDIYGAQQVGIRAGFFNPKEDGFSYGEEFLSIVHPDFEINEFSDLLKEFGL